MITKTEVKRGGKWVLATPQNGDFCKETYDCGSTFEYTFNATLELTLEQLQEIKRKEIKATAHRKVKDLDWRLERAKERESIGIMGTDVESVKEVLLLREAIRQSSNEAELRLASLASAEEVKLFHWA